MVERTHISTTPKNEFCTLMLETNHKKPKKTAASQTAKVFTDCLQKVSLLGTTNLHPDLMKITLQAKI